MFLNKGKKKKSPCVCGRRRYCYCRFFPTFTYVYLQIPTTLCSVDRSSRYNPCK